MIILSIFFIFQLRVCVAKDGCSLLWSQYTEKARSIWTLYWHRVKYIFFHINNKRELHSPWKGKTNDKHKIISSSPRTLQRQGDLIISSQKLLSLKDIYFISCSKTSALTYFRMMCWHTYKNCPPESTFVLRVKLLPSSFVSQCTALVHWNLSPR